MEPVNDGTHGENTAAPYATVAGTARYRARFSHLDAEHFRLRYGLWLSSIGLGSYLSPGSTSNGATEINPINLADGFAANLSADLADELIQSGATQSGADDAPNQPSADDSAADASGSYFQATQTALRMGCNVLDTASNYRAARSEQEIGAALRAEIDAGKLHRDEVLVCTKGGYLTQGNPIQDNSDMRARVEQSAAIEALHRIIREPAVAEEIVGQDAGGPHCIAPDYLRASIGASLAYLGLEAIDVYYLHNPETQLRAVDPQEFRRRMQRAFEHLEGEAEDGRIRLYGVATWDGLRADPQDRIYLPLTWLEALAREVGGEKHRFRFIQFPYNALTRTAFSARNQPLPGKQEDTGEPVFGPLLAAAMQMGVTAVTSATLAQGRVLERLPAQFTRALGEWESRAQAAIQFNRSTPGVTTTLVGMGGVAHVEENMAVASHPPLPREDFFRLFQRPAN